MLSVSKARQLLGKVAENMSDKEVEQLRDEMDRLADFVFDTWKESLNLDKQNDTMELLTQHN